MVPEQRDRKRGRGWGKGRDWGGRQGLRRGERGRGEKEKQLERSKIIEDECESDEKGERQK